MNDVLCCVGSPVCSGCVRDSVQAQWLTSDELTSVPNGSLTPPSSICQDKLSSIAPLTDHCSASVCALKGMLLQLAAAREQAAKCKGGMTKGQEEEHLQEMIREQRKEDACPTQ